MKPLDRGVMKKFAVLFEHSLKTGAISESDAITFSNAIFNMILEDKVRRKRPPKRAPALHPEGNSP